MIKKKIIKFLDKLGYGIIKKGYPNTVSYSDQMVDGLKRFSNNISNIHTVIDVGAAAGTWYEKAHQVWPQTNYVLFEPLIERTRELEEIKQKNDKVSVIFAALGKEQSKLKFTVSDDLDGSGFYGTGIQREVPVEYLDGIISKEKIKGPYILKLDTHGFEIPIFEGAANTLKNTELVIVEVYGFYVAPNSLLFWQICEYLDDKGFRLVDMVDIMRREKDKAFWQCDAFFIKKTNKIFENNSYS